MGEINIYSVRWHVQQAEWQRTGIDFARTSGQQRREDDITIVALPGPRPRSSSHTARSACTAAVSPQISVRLEPSKDNEDNTKDNADNIIH